MDSKKVLVWSCVIMAMVSLVPFLVTNALSGDAGFAAVIATTFNVFVVVGALYTDAFVVLAAHAKDAPGAVLVAVTGSGATTALVGLLSVSDISVMPTAPAALLCVPAVVFIGLRHAKKYNIPKGYMFRSLAAECIGIALPMLYFTLK